MHRVVLAIVLFMAAGGAGLSGAAQDRVLSEPFVQVLNPEETVAQGTTELFPPYHQPIGTWTRTFAPRLRVPVLGGMDGYRFGVFRDGIAVATGPSPAPEVASGMSLFDADTVRTVRGPKTLLYGIGSVGGVI